MRLHNLLRLSLVLLLSAASHLALAGPNVLNSKDTNAATKNKAAIRYAQMPIAFELNRGQSDPQVKALARGAGYGLFLTADESVLVLAHNFDKTTVVRTKLLGANTSAQVLPVDRLAGTVNSFIGKDRAKWQTDVPTFAKMKYEEIYPGVDLIYYGNQGQLEYDFVLAPGADPRAIRFAITGAKIQIDSHGDLVMRTKLGEVRHHKPVIYQDIDGVRHAVTGRFVRRAANEVAFALAPYDREHSLVIDPSLNFSTYLGGGAADEARAVIVDALGDTLIGGFTSSINFPVAQCATPPVEPCAANPPPYGAYLGGSTDAFFTVIFFQPLQPNGPPGSELFLSTYFGGSGADTLNAFTIIQNAFVPTIYAVGTTTSTDIPLTNPLQATPGGGSDAFVAVLDFPNVVGFATYLGGSGNESGNAIALDSLGNVIVGGSTTSTNFPTVNAIQPASGGGMDGFVTKINNVFNSYIYSTYLGGAGGDGVASIADSPTTDVAYIVGQTTSGGFAASHQVSGAAGPAYKAFLTALSSDGQTVVLPTQIFGGSGTSYAKAVALDPAGNVWLTGFTTSTNFPTMNPIQAANAGGQDAFLMEVNSSGALQFSTYYGGTGNDESLAIAIVQSNQPQSTCTTTLACLFIAGTTNSTNFPTVKPLHGAKGGYDGFVTEFLLNTGATPTVGYSTYLGAGGNDIITSVAASRQGNATVVGYTNSVRFPVTTGVVQPTNAGGIDSFATKINTK